MSKNNRLFAGKKNISMSGNNSEKDRRVSDTDKKKDVLKDVLSRSESGSFYGEKDLLEIIYQTEAQQKKPTFEKAIKKRTTKRKRQSKKTTHYLSEEIFDTLGDAKEKLRDMLPDEKLSNISKSGIVNFALDMILKEFDAKGDSSLLVKKIKAHTAKSKK
jgi:hypothetical protein